MDKFSKGIQDQDFDNWKNPLFWEEDKGRSEEFMVDYGVRFWPRVEFERKPAQRIAYLCSMDGYGYFLSRWADPERGRLRHESDEAIPTWTSRRT